MFEYERDVIRHGEHRADEPRSWMAEVDRAPAKPDMRDEIRPQPAERCDQPPGRLPDRWLEGREEALDFLVKRCRQFPVPS